MVASQLSGASSGGKQQLRFLGEGSTLFGMFIVNVLLSMVTLGIYSFWGKVNIRRYLYGQTELMGDRFAYHGTGKELFLGALKFFGLLIVFGLLLALLSMVLGPFAVFLAYVAAFLAVPYALWASMRYRLSRTSWRGIRFNFRGSLADCFRIYLPGVLLSGLTLGIYYPFFRARMRTYWINNSYLGNTPFKYDGEGGALLGSFIIAALLSLPTLNLIWFWYLPKQERYDWSHTTFEGARFASELTGSALLGHLIVNGLLSIVTLGLAFPWIMVRMLRFRFDVLSFSGDANLAKVAQDASALRAGAAGDTMADALDVGAAIS